MDAEVPLSLEPLFLSEHGAVVYDVVDSKPVFEQKKAAATKLRESIARLHAERGPDISQLTIENVQDPEVDLASDDGEPEQSDDTPAHLKLGGPMPFDDLIKMRDEISFNIHQASLQIVQFQAIAKLLLSGASAPAPSDEAASSSIAVSASAMAPSEQKTSIRSTNVRVTLGLKDSSVEAATTVLSRASSDISSFATRNQLRWEQAMRARKAHWSMLPHRQPPAPHQSPFFRRDESSIPRNFLISFSLEESPPQFRRHALVSFNDREQSENDDILIFPSHPRRRLRIGLSRHLTVGSEVLAATEVIDPDDSSDQQSSTIERRLRRGQREVVGEEIFSLLVQEAATFPSAASFVSERRVSIVVTKETSLTFELVAADDESSNFVRTGSESEDSVLSNLILHLLILLLLRMHRTRRLLNHAKSGVVRDRPIRIDDLAYPSSQLNSTLRTATGAPVTPILAPVVSLLQYRAFCSAMHADLSKIASGLKATGIPCELMFTPVGETSQEVITMLERVDGSTGSANDLTGGPSGGGGKDDTGLQLSGEALLWVDNSHAIRMTFSSPTTLTLHLPHATLAITSLNILRTFITSEVTLTILMRLQEEGNRIFPSGRWALDTLDPACIGTWDERNASLRWTVGFDEQLRIHCTVSSEVTRSNGSIVRQVQHYDCTRDASAVSSDPTPKKLLEWFKASTRTSLGYSQKVY